jgi:hypothetical protein
MRDDADEQGWFDSVGYPGLCTLVLLVCRNWIFYPAEGKQRTEYLRWITQTNTPRTTASTTTITTTTAITISLSCLVFIVGHCWLSYTHAIRELIGFRPSHCVNNIVTLCIRTKLVHRPLSKGCRSAHSEGSVCRPTQTCRGTTDI